MRTWQHRGTLRTNKVWILLYLHIPLLPSPQLGVLPTAATISSRFRWVFFRTHDTNSMTEAVATPFPFAELLTQYPKLARLLTLQIVLMPTLPK